LSAANVLINKKMLGVALKVQSCFSGIALDAVTSLGLHRSGEWRMKLLTDSPQAPATSALIPMQATLAVPLVAQQPLRL
jgi:hypothetical protein